MNETKTYIGLLKLTQPEKFGKLSPKEQAIVNEHFERLKRALDEENLVLAGPCLDGAFGIAIFKAESEKEAANFMENDPAVQKGLMSAELHPFRISLMKKT